MIFFQALSPHDRIPKHKHVEFSRSGSFGSGRSILPANRRSEHQQDKGNGKGISGALHEKPSVILPQRTTLREVCLKKTAAVQPNCDRNSASRFSETCKR